MSTAIIDYRTSDEEILELEKLGLDFLLCPPCSEVHTSISGHPDMQLVLINYNTILVHKEIDDMFCSQLSIKNIRFYKSHNKLFQDYPHDIILNSLILGDKFVHNLKYSDPVLLNLVKGKELINVNQGYTKCSTAIVNEKAIITSDMSILRALQNTSIDILYVPPGDIELNGLEYGFIGGTCGLLKKGFLAFFGDLNQYAYGESIIQFLEKHNVKPIYLRKGKLVDRGSLFII